MLDGKLTANQAAFAGGVLGGVMFFVFSIAIVYYILFIIAAWKVFKKAGEPGWKSLIPIYNSYIFYKIVGMTKWFWIMLLSAFAVSFITSLMGFDNNNLANNSFTGINLLAFFLFIAESIFTIAISIMNSIRTSKAFGHGVGFAIGLILLQNIFLLIIGFGKSKYNKKLVKSWK